MAFLAVFVILLTIFCGASSTPNPSSRDKFCYDYSVNKLAPCAPYLAPGSGKVNPKVDDLCCQGLRDIFNDEPQCVCFLIEPNNGLPPYIDPNKALFLPAPCNASVPPINKCFGAGSPAGAPTERPPVARAGPPASAFFAGMLLAAVAAFL